MKNDKWLDLTNGVCWSIIFSLAAIIMSIVALAHTHPRSLYSDNSKTVVLGFDYIGVIVAILALLVTFLVAWQIWQTIASKEDIREMKKTAEKLEELERSLEAQRNLFNQHNLEIKNLIDAHAKISEAEKIKDLHIKYTTYAEALDLLLQSNVGVNYEQFDNILYGLNGIIGKLSDINNLSFEEIWNILESEKVFEWHCKQIMSRLEKRSDEIDELKRKLNLIRELREGVISDIKQSEKGKAIAQKKREIAESLKRSK